MANPLDINLIEQMNKADLAAALNQLIETDFYALVQLLYRIDIDENKLKDTLHNTTEKNAGELIADLIIQRQQQKLMFRKQFSSKPESEDSSEKW